MQTDPELIAIHDALKNIVRSLPRESKANLELEIEKYLSVLDYLDKEDPRIQVSNILLDACAFGYRAPEKDG